MTIDVVLRDLSKWLAATPLSHTIQNAGWVIPTLQTISAKTSPGQDWPVPSPGAPAP